MSQPKWITPELIDLSKRAKELGFPQDVVEGDWLIVDGISEPYLCGEDYDVEEDGIYIDGTMLCETKEYVLILSFSRCLEWLEANNKGEMIGLDLNNFIHGHWIMGIKTKTHRGKNIHECGAKAVVKRLEEN